MLIRLSGEMEPFQVRRLSLAIKGNLVQVDQRTEDISWDLKLHPAELELVASKGCKRVFTRSLISRTMAMTSHGFEHVCEFVSFRV